MTNITTEIIISQGKLKGGIAKTESGVEYVEYLDIPYAKPPIGDLRFKPPQPPSSWEGSRDASKINLNHLSCQYVKGQTIGSEDCLYLNVYIPILPKQKSELLPIMVHIHGGGFMDGSGTNKNEAGPDYFLDKNIIYVAMNYRLCILGFLTLDIPEVAGNMGLKDQVQALKWIQDNLQSFGGDINNVTIIGSSAGGAFVDYLILAPSARGLFHKAIQQSASSFNHWTFNHGQKTLLIDLLQDLHYNGPLDDVYAIYKYLLKVPVSILTVKSKKRIRAQFSNRINFGFVPTVEKDFGDSTAIITEEPYVLYKKGKYSKVPVIKGFCNKEGYLTIHSKDNVLKTILQTRNVFDCWPYPAKEDDVMKYTSAFRTAYFDTVQHTDDETNIVIDFFSDFDVIAGVWLQGKIQADDGVPVFVYEFSYDGNLNFVKCVHNIKREGAAHADDIGYLYKCTFGDKASKEDLAIRHLLTTLWANFVKTGSPTTPDELPIKWPAFTSQSPVYLNINTSLTIKSDYEPKRMKIFEEIYRKYKK